METTAEDIELVTLDESLSINIDSPIPYYYQLYEKMRSKLISGEWKTGQKLPSENSLCSFFKVSRTVVRQTLNELSADNLIVTYKGRGSFVAPKKNSLQLMQTLTGFYDDAISQGQSVTTKILQLEVRHADKEIAGFLEVPDNTPVIFLRRHRFINGESVVVVDTYLPESICPGLVNEDLTDKSLYHLLSEKYGLQIAEGIRTIESVNASPQMAKLLGIPNGSALTLLKSITRLSDGTPLEYYISWHRGDRSRFTVRLVAGHYGVGK